MANTTNGDGTSLEADARIMKECAERLARLEARLRNTVSLPAEIRRELSESSARCSNAGGILVSVAAMLEPMDAEPR